MWLAQTTNEWFEGGHLLHWRIGACNSDFELMQHLRHCNRCVHATLASMQHLRHCNTCVSSKWLKTLKKATLQWRIFSFRIRFLIADGIKILKYNCCNDADLQWRLCCNGASVALPQVLHWRMCCIGASVALTHVLHWRMSVSYTHLTLPTIYSV